MTLYLSEVFYPFHTRQESFSNLTKTTLPWDVQFSLYNVTMTIVLSRAPQSAGFIQTLWVQGVRNIQERGGVV